MIWFACFLCGLFVVRMLICQFPSLFVCLFVCFLLALLIRLFVSSFVCFSCLICVTQTNLPQHPGNAAWWAFVWLVCFFVCLRACLFVFVYCDSHSVFLCLIDRRCTSLICFEFSVFVAFVLCVCLL